MIKESGSKLKTVFYVLNALYSIAIYAILFAVALYPLSILIGHKLILGGVSGSKMAIVDLFIAIILLALFIVFSIFFTKIVSKKLIIFYDKRLKEWKKIIFWIVYVALLLALFLVNYFFFF